MVDVVVPQEKRRWLPYLDEESVRRRVSVYLMVIAGAAGLIGTIASGPVRRISIFLLFACIMLTVLLTTRYPVLDRVTMDDKKHFKTPKERAANVLYIALVAIYNISILVVVVAFLVRSNILNLEFSPRLLDWAPFTFAAYYLIMAAASRMRVEQLGIHANTWYIRLQHAFLILLTVTVGFVSIGMIFVDELNLLGLSISEADLLVTILFAWVSAVTQMFFLAGLPTMYDLIMGFFTDKEEDEFRSQTPPIVYAGFTALGITLFFGFVASRIGLFTAVGGQLSSERGAYILLLLPVAMAIFFLYTGIQLFREGKRGAYIKKIPTKLRNDLIVYGFAAIAGIIMSIITYATIQGSIDKILFWETTVETPKDLIFITLLVTLGPIGFYTNGNARRVDHIELRLADFLSDLAETRRAGLTLSAALHSAAASDYGALSKEVQKMSHQIAWGVPFTESMRQFSERVKSPLVERTTNLIIEASRSGGQVSAILKAAANDAREIKTLEQERKITLTTYMVIIYVTFFVFMVVIGSLDSQFIPQVAEAQSTIRESNFAADSGQAGFGNVLNEKPLDRDALRFTYFNSAIVQSIGNGIIAGLLVDQRLTSGFRHVAIMAFMAWLLFRWILPLAS